MSHVLVINPNTSEHVTCSLLRHIGGGMRTVSFHGVTAAFGEQYIRDERSFCLAGHAVLDAWQRAQPKAPQGGYDAVVIGCLADPGLQALRESTHTPVLGLTQTALRTLKAHGARRVAIIASSEQWRDLMTRWSRANGHDLEGGVDAVRVAGIRIFVMSSMGTQGAGDAADAGDEALAQCCAQAMHEFGADAVLIGGAGLVGMGARVRALSGARVWDSVEACQWWLARMLPPPGVSDDVQLADIAPVPVWS